MEQKRVNVFWQERSKCQGTHATPQHKRHQTHEHTCQGTETSRAQVPHVSERKENRSGEGKRLCWCEERTGDHGQSKSFIPTVAIKSYLLISTIDTPKGAQ